MLQILNTGVASAEQNMDEDAKLLETLDPKGNPILHLYRWAGPSLTFGHFIAPGQHIDLAQAEKHRLSCARRPTGGGIIFHIWDLAFSFLMPASHPSFSLNTLKNYRFVNQIVSDAMQEYFSLKDVIELIPESAPALAPSCQNFCMAKPTQYDAMYRGMKIAGAAQRKRKQGYLHQGTLSLSLPHLGLLRDVLISQKEVTQAIFQYTFAPLGRAVESKAFEEARSGLEQLLAQKFMEKL